MCQAVQLQKHPLSHFFVGEMAVRSENWTSADRGEVRHNGKRPDFRLAFHLVPKVGLEPTRF